MILKQAILFLYISISLVIISCHDENLKWNLPLSNTALRNQPVLSENYICFQTDSFIQICDKRNGQLMRSIPAVNSQLCKTTLSSNTLFVIGETIFAFDILQNKFLWLKKAELFIDKARLDSFPDSITYNNANTNAFVYDSLLLFGNSLGFYALSIKTGNEIWRHNYYSPATAHLAELSGNNLFLIKDHNVVSADPLTGKEKWHYNIVAFSPTNIATTGDTVIIGGRHAMTFLLINGTTGSLLKQYDVDDRMYSQPLIAHGVMHYTNTVNQLVAAKLRNGSLKWKIDPENDEVDFSPIMCNGKIVWSGGNSCHHIYFIDPETGNIIQKFYSEDEIIAPLVTDNNVIYYLTTKNLMALTF